MFMTMKTVLEMVELEKVEAAEDLSELKALIKKHFDHTQSTVARRILDDWDQSVAKFVKVMPTDYKRVLQTLKDSAKPQQQEDKMEVV